MKKFILFLIFLVAAFGIYWMIVRPAAKHKSEKMAPIALKKHSEVFNNSVDRVLVTYLDIKNAFIEDDAAKAKTGAGRFILLLDSIPVEELKKDTAMIYDLVKANLNDIKLNAESLMKQTDITEMRKDFSSLTDVMYPSFFKAINYEGSKLYLQNCPMAFGDDAPANWISNSAEILNPYLGKNHPEYKGTMLHCGEIKDTIKAQ